MAVNKSDWSYGWHGHRAGLALYYFDKTILLNEHHELRYENMKFSKQESEFTPAKLHLQFDIGCDVACTADGDENKTTWISLYKMLTRNTSEQMLSREN